MESVLVFKPANLQNPNVIILIMDIGQVLSVFLVIIHLKSFLWMGLLKAVLF